MSTDVEHYSKCKNWKCYELMPQDTHYAELVSLAAKFRYNRLERFRAFMMGGMLQRNQMVQNKIDKFIKRRLRTEERILQPIKNGVRRQSLFEYPQLGRKITERLKIQQEKNKKLMKALHNSENEISTITME